MLAVCLLLPFVQLTQEKKVLRGEEVLLGTLPEKERVRTGTDPYINEFEVPYPPPRHAFSPDGKHAAWWQRISGDKCAVMVNGKAQGEYDYVSSPVFLPDGRLVYKATVGEEERLVVDGKPLSSWSGISEYVCSTKGNKIAYAAEKAEDDWWIVVDESAVPCPVPGQPRLLNFDDKGLLTYFVIDAKTRVDTLVMGDGSTLKLDLNQRSFTRVSFAGGVSAFLTYTKGGCILPVVNGKPRTPGFGSTVVPPRHPILSPNGDLAITVAAKEKDGENLSVHVGDRVFGPYRSAGEVRFSKDGSCFGFSAREGDATEFCAVVDAKRKITRHAGAANVRFDADNRPVFLRWGEDTRLRLETSDWRTSEYDWLADPTFDTKAGTMSFGARSGRRLVWVTIKR